jgi:hypothetical protein
MHPICPQMQVRQGGRHGSGGGMGYTCMEIYTDGKNQVLTTGVTDKITVISIGRCIW